MLYGYINESGYLVTREVDKYEEYYNDAKGETKKRIISIEEIIETLEVNGFKPVDIIDHSKLRIDSGSDYLLVPKPYDNGDRISFNYIKQFDYQKIRGKIEILKKDLSDTDFKITKCYEASLLGEDLPYDIAKLNKQRQFMRNLINDLEKVMIKKIIEESN